jgi:regulatory protein
MLITDIKPIDDKRFCLYADYEAFGPVYKSDLRRLKLQQGAEIPDEKLMAFRQEYFYKRAMNKAVSSLGFSEKCEYDIRQKLARLCYDDEIIDTTLNTLRRYGYVDDLRYATCYIKSHIKKSGLKNITYQLSAKHISEDIIDEAISLCEIPDEGDIIREILVKRYSMSQLANSQDKVIRYMAGKGYDYRSVKTCLRELCEDICEQAYE